MTEKTAEEFWRQLREALEQEPTTAAAVEKVLNDFKDYLKAAQADASAEQKDMLMRAVLFVGDSHWAKSKSNGGERQR